MVRRSDGFKIFDVDKDPNDVPMVSVVTDNVAVTNAMKIKKCIAAALVKPPVYRSKILDKGVYWTFTCYLVIRNHREDSG